MPPVTRIGPCPSLSPAHPQARRIGSASQPSSTARLSPPQCCPSWLSWRCTQVLGLCGLAKSAAVLHCGHKHCVLSCMRLSRVHRRKIDLHSRSLYWLHWGRRCAWLSPETPPQSSISWALHLCTSTPPRACRAGLPPCHCDLLLCALPSGAPVPRAAHDGHAAALWQQPQQ